MKIIVFGSSSGVGRQLIDQANEAGHIAGAFTRDASKFIEPGVPIFQGDVLSYSDCQEAIDEFEPDATAITVGGDMMGNQMTRANATRNILEAMSGRCQRVICLSSLGVGESMQMLSPAAQQFMPMVLGGALRDHELQEQYIVGSSFQWSIIRPARLIDGPRTGIYKTGTDIQPGISSQISRADVADFILQILPDETTYQQKYWITK